MKKKLSVAEEKKFLLQIDYEKKKLNGLCQERTAYDNAMINGTVVILTIAILIVEFFRDYILKEHVALAIAGIIIFFYVYRKENRNRHNERIRKRSKWVDGYYKKFQNVGARL
jgi:hypothetical protein